MRYFATFVFGMLVVLAATAPLLANRYRLHSDGNQLYRIDTWTGRTYREEKVSHGMMPFTKPFHAQSIEEFVEEDKLKKAGLWKPDPTEVPLPAVPTWVVISEPVKHSDSDSKK